MHFRERGKIVQIIRTSYDPDSKKGKNEIVGRLVKNNLKMSSQLESALSDKEKKEVKAWIDGYGSTERLKKELAARTLPEQMAITEEWFADHKGDDARVLAATLYRSWVQLRQSLKKSGLIE
jgi:hypothetical protein